MEVVVQFRKRRRRAKKSGAKIWTLIAPNKSAKSVRAIERLVRFCHAFGHSFFGWYSTGTGGGHLAANAMGVVRKRHGFGAKSHITWSLADTSSAVKMNSMVADEFYGQIPEGSS
jgi:hypothetical protein